MYSTNLIFIEKIGCKIKLVVFLVFILLSSSLSAQLNQWAWMNGSSETSQIGTYGTIGSGSPTVLSSNPGGRNGSISWTDTSGNYWLFGGHGFGSSAIQGYLNDLWKYNSSTNDWTWVNGGNTINQVGEYGNIGVADSNNHPGGRRQSISWIDSSGNFWLFGGHGYSSFSGTGYLNDLWKYDITTNQWTWYKGDSLLNEAGSYGTQGSGAPFNIPGARFGSISWTDTNGDLWLFGGYGMTPSGGGYLNDLWKYSVTNNQWTWVSGSDTANQVSNYGTLGISVMTNSPGGRVSSTSWIDSNGDFWLHGGKGFASSNTLGDLNDLWKYNPTTNEWTWIKGSNFVNHSGNYGVIGVSSTSNFPGARENSLSWTDTTGNLWLFGGINYVNSTTVVFYNDLWKYDPFINQWTWVKGSNNTNQFGIYGTAGVADSLNTPGARYQSIGWSNNQNELWLFGGAGYLSSSGDSINDLWKYNVTLNNWTWMKGNGQVGVYGTAGMTIVNNTPGARQSSVGWNDTIGNFWLFGGSGYGAFVSPSKLNDLWKYNTYLNQWTWMKGSMSINEVGSYGTLGISDSLNNPGARSEAISWTDANGDFWLFGGSGLGYSAVNGVLNDLWKYNVSTNQWTWMKGSDLINQTGAYGTIGVASSSNNPRSRYGSISWTDTNGNLWLFGGIGIGGRLNDLWKYSISTNQWTWVKGSNSENQIGTYGTLGVSASSNTPGARHGSVSWIDSSGNLWLFGGFGLGATTAQGRLNDLWKYNPLNNEWSWMKGSNLIDQPGTSGTMGVTATSNTPSARFGSSSWTDSNGYLWLFAGSSIPISYSELWKYDIATNQWMWVNGNTYGSNYGILGVADSSNVPGSRIRSLSFIDTTGNLWLFGGYSIGSSYSGNGFRNDLWKYTIICHPSSSVTIDTICDSYFWSANNTTYTSSGTYTTTLTNSGGCDSLLTLNLTVKNSSSSSQSVTACSSYNWPITGSTYTSSGAYNATFTNSVNCDSIVTLNLTLNNNGTSDTISVCNSYTWPVDSTTYTNSGVYSSLFTNSFGCDSIVSLYLTINYDNTSSQTVTACDTFTWSANNTTYVNSGIYVTTLTNSGGCDSVVTLNLSINQSNASSQTESVCIGYTWPANNVTYTSSGIYSTTLTNSSNCDSIVTLNLTVNNNASFQTETACDTYTWSANNQTYTSSGTYSTTLTNAANCDSVVTLNLTINNANSSTTNEVACDSYTWPADSQTYTSSGTYSSTLTNALGCDSLLTLNLTINNSNAGIDSITACNSYTWIDGVTYTASNNTSTHLLTNAAGCDSLVTLNLTLDTASSALFTVTSCDNYLWPVTGQTYTSTGLYSTSMTNAAGCDSLISLNLIIETSTGSASNQVACDSFTWPANNQIYTSSGTYSTTLTNSVGCDSLLTLNLIINNSNAGIDMITACNSYTWIDGVTYTTSNNTATHLLTNVTGCDSLVTLNLTINNSNAGSQTETACVSYTWPEDTQTYTVSGTYTTTLTNAAGCDSIITLDLTIIPVDTSVTLNAPELTSNAVQAQYQWLNCDSVITPIVGADSQSFTPTVNGIYAVEITENGCVDTSACYTINNVGFSESSVEDDFILYPNPTLGQVTIEFSESQQSVDLILRNALGQEVMRKSYQSQSQIDLFLNVDAGVYFIELKRGNNTSNLRVIKE